MEPAVKKTLSALPLLIVAGLALMLESVTLPVNRQDACVVQEAIQQCCGQRGILRKGRIPLPKRQIAGDDQ